LERSVVPHIIVKLWPGQTEQQKKQLAERMTQDVMDVLHYGDESVSVAIEEINAKDWAEKVYKPDILNKSEQLYKKPGYDLSELP
jgi:4-oxalocrotonate tautomerase